MDGMDRVDLLEAGKKIEPKAAPAPVKCKLKFPGLILYGKAVRRVNERIYKLAIDKTTTVEAGDLEALKKQEPNLHIVR